MPNTIHEDGKLNFNRSLQDIQVVVEDMMVAYLLEDAVKGGWAHANLPSELIDITVTPHGEEMNLRTSYDLAFGA
jgi:hypothetical protein